MGNAAEVLRCEAISKAFDGIQALRRVSLDFPPASIIAIIGPNGAGKTTFLNILTGFLRPDSGRCFIGDHETTNLQPYQIVRLGLARTFQDLRLILQVSVLDNVLLACTRKKDEGILSALIHSNLTKKEDQDRAEAIDLLRFVGLEEKAKEPAGTLSYGQQKLLTLACCLATKAQILFLDEPVAGVHPEMAARILALLKQIREEGRQVIFIEHDISAVRQIADRVIVMDEGGVIAQGHPEDVLERPEIMEAYLA